MSIAKKKNKRQFPIDFYLYLFWQCIDVNPKFNRSIRVILFDFILWPFDEFFQQDHFKDLLQCQSHAKADTEVVPSAFSNFWINFCGFFLYNHRRQICKNRCFLTSFFKQDNLSNNKGNTEVDLDEPFATSAAFTSKYHL